MPAGPAKLAIETGAACCPAHCWYTRDSWVFDVYAAAGHVVGRRRARSRRRWPTGSPAASPPIPPTGTCCSRSGWPTCPRSARDGQAEAATSRDAHRHGLPVLVRRPRRRAVACAATGRGDATRAATTSACWRRRRRTSKLPDYVVSGGKAVPIPYNGSVARLRFGPATHRKVKSWLADGDFDVLHLHEPNAPSLSMLALKIAEGPIVATFHTSTTKSLTLSVFRGHPAADAREDRRPHRGVGSGPALADGGAGHRTPSRSPTASTSRRSRRRRRSTATRGRASRCCSSAASTSRARAWPCCSARCPRWSKRFPDIEILIVGRGDEDELRERGRDTGRAPALPRPGRRRREGVGDAQRRRVLRAATPAARASASCSSRRWPRAPRWWPATSTRSAGCWTTGRPGGWCRSTTPTGSPPALIEVLEDDVARERYVEAATEAVRRYDWSVVAGQIMRVYETVAGAGAKVQVAGAS